MHHSLWDPLPIKVGHLIQEDDILKECGTTGTNGLDVQFVSHRATPTCGHAIRILNREKLIIIIQTSFSLQPLHIKHWYAKLLHIIVTMICCRRSSNHLNSSSIFHVFFIF